MAKQGLIFIKARTKDPFNLALSSNGIESFYQYVSTDSTNEHGHLGLFPVSNVLSLDANTIQKELGGDAEVRVFEHLLKFEPLHETKPGRASCAHIATLDPAEGEEKDFNDWYRLQHLDMLSTCPGYRRSFRNKLLSSTRKGCPAWTAIHDFESTDLPLKEILFTSKTEWSNKILSGAKAFEAENWEFKGVKGKEGDV